MIEFAKSRGIAFKELSEFETIRRFSDIPITHRPPFLEAWEVKKEVEIQGSIIDITFVVCFLEDFPFSIPKIYLTKKDYDRLGYIPHVDSNRCICTYPPDTVVLDIAKPEGIVLQCLRQARVNIADGVNGKNEDDFNDEYLAYWKQTYPGEQEPIEFCLNLIETEIDTVCFIKYGAFKYPAGKYKNCLYLEDNDFRRVKENLNNSLNNDIIEVNE